jgi:hypothetical protein
LGRGWQWLEWASRYGESGYSSNVVVPHLARERGKEAVWICEKVMLSDPDDVSNHPPGPLVGCPCTRWLPLHSSKSYATFTWMDERDVVVRSYRAGAHAEGAELSIGDGGLRNFRH